MGYFLFTGYFLWDASFAFADQCTESFRSTRLFRDNLGSLKRLFIISLLHLQLHLLHQSFQVGIFLSLSNTRLILTLPTCPHIRLYDHVSSVLLYHGLQLADCLVEEVDSLLVLHRSRRHHIQRRSDQCDLRLTPFHCTHRHGHILRSHRFCSLLDVITRDFVTMAARMPSTP